MTKAIVIGSGAGGSFAAMELAKAGWQVTIFEKGPNHFTNLGGQGPFGTVFANDSLAMLQRYFAEPDPEVFPRTWRPNPSAPAQTGSVDELPQVVGGGTVHWDAKVPRFWDIDFQQRSALGPVDGADVADWPFSYHDLAPYYDEVERLIGVQGDTTTFPDLVRKHAPRSGQYPMPPGPQMRSSTAIAHGAAARSRWRPIRSAATTASTPATTAGSAAASAARWWPARPRSSRCARRCAPAGSS
jgi:choline dehydrogenase-like flavoprotein